MWLVGNGYEQTEKHHLPPVSALFPVPTLSAPIPKSYRQQTSLWLAGPNKSGWGPRPLIPWDPVRHMDESHRDEQSCQSPPIQPWAPEPSSSPRSSQNPPLWDGACPSWGLCDLWYNYKVLTRGRRGHSVSLHGKVEVCRLEWALREGRGEGCFSGDNVWSWGVWAYGGGNGSHRRCLTGRSMVCYAI